MCKWWEPILASVSEFERKYWNGWIQDGQIQDGEIQDAWHHQVESEWMSLSQNELVWVRVRVEWECFWVNLREDNKVFESKMAVFQSDMAEFKMSAIIKLSQNEWMKFFLFKMVESKMADLRCLTSSSWARRNEWSIFFESKMAESHDGDNSRWLPSSS